MMSDQPLKTQSRTRYLLIVMTLVVVIAGLWPLITHVRVAEYDEAIFLDVARNIRESGRPVRSYGVDGIYYFEHTPLYAYLISPITGQTDDRVAITRGLTVVFALGCVGLVFLCGEKLMNTSAGFVAAVLTAANSFFLLYAYFVTMEVLMAFLILLSFYCLIRSETTGARRWCFLAGLALAGAVLTKEVALGLTVVYFIYGVFFSRWPDRVRRLFLLIGPALTALLAWVVWAWGWSPVAAQAALQRWFASAALGGFDFRMQITASEWTEKLGGDLLGWGMSALFLISLFFYVRAVRNKTRAALVPLLYVVLAVVFSYLIRLKEPRHLLAVVPMAALVIGLGMSQLFTDLQVRQGRGAQLLVGALLIFVVLDASPIHFSVPGVSNAVSLDPLYAYRLNENDRYNGVLRSAGRYLSEHISAGEVVNVVHEATVVSFYANRPYRMLYTLPFDAIIENLSKSRYLIYDDRVFPLLDESQIQSVDAYIRDHYSVETEIVENGRTVTIYRNSDMP